MKKYHLGKSFMSAAGVFIYISLVAWVMNHAQAIFGQSKSFLQPVLILLLFVVSATVTGLLVLGRPADMYMKGQKKEAFTALFATLGWLVVFLAVVIALLIK